MPEPPEDVLSLEDAKAGFSVAASSKNKWELAWAYYSERDFESARKAFLDLRHHSSYGEAATSAAAFCLVGLQRVEEAAAELEFAAASESEPKSKSYLHAVIGLLSWNSGNKVSARRHYASALNYDPKNVRALAGLGLVEASEGRLVDAITLFEDASVVGEGAERAMAHTYAAKACLEAGQYDRGRQHLATSIGLPKSENIELLHRELSARYRHIAEPDRG